VFVALVIQHAMRMRHVACVTPKNFTTLSKKRHDFRGKKVIEDKSCVLIFSTTSVPRRTNEI
jgi:hypothetical protein